MKIDYVALVRLNKNRELLFSELIRCRKESLTREGIIHLIERVLKQNKSLPTNQQASKILKELLGLGGINEQ